MKRIQKVIYYVEGQTEEKLIKVLKKELKCLVPGKTVPLNVLTQVLNYKIH